jgi:hypothetical protein
MDQYRERHQRQMNLKQRETSESELVVAHQELWTLAKQVAAYHSQGPLDATSQLRLKMRQRCYDRQRGKVEALQRQVNELLPRSAQVNVQPSSQRKRGHEGDAQGSVQNEGQMLELLKRMKLPPEDEDEDETVEDL